LLEYGFTHFASPCGPNGSSSYTRWAEDGSVIRLWGFGVLVQLAGGQSLFFRRYQWLPWVVSKDLLHASVYLLPQIERFLEATKRTHSELSTVPFCILSHELGNYEEWVSRHVGPAWRPKTMREGGDMVRPVPDLGAAWRRVHREVVPRGLLV
jgi:hypothetical protein